MTKNLVSGLISAPLAQMCVQKNFRGFYLRQMLDIVASYHCMQFQGKLMNQLEKMVKNRVSSPILAHLTQIRTPNLFFSKTDFVGH